MDYYKLLIHLISRGY